MDIKVLLDCVLALGSNVSIADGKEIYKKRLVSNLSSKKIEDTYHIYSKVNDNNKVYSCHIKFDIKHKKVIGTKCTCDVYEEFSKLKKNYVCKHIVATIFYFYIVAKDKLKKSNKIITKDNKKQLNSKNIEVKKLNLGISVKENVISNIKYYDFSFKIGFETLYTILNIREFIKFKSENKLIRINSEFLYNPKFMILSGQDEEFLEYFRNLLSDNKCTVVDGKIIRCEDSMLRQIINFIDMNKKINLNYDYVNYETCIYKEDLPLCFTVKLERKNVITTTKKKLPIPLDKDFSIFLYERKIFLPSTEQTSIYKGLWVELRSKSFIKVEDDSEKILGLLSQLNKISNDITLGEGIKKLCRAFWNVNMDIILKNNKILCTVFINYLNRKTNILEDKNIDPFRDLELEGYTCMCLERLRFIKKDSKYVFIGNDDDLYEFFTDGIAKLNKIGKVNINEEVSKVGLIDSSYIDSEFNEEYENLNFTYNIEGVEFNEYKEIFNKLEEDKPYYKTKSNKLLNLRDLGVKKFFNMLNILSNSKDFNGEMDIDKNKSAYLDASIVENSLEFIRGADLIKTISQNLKEASLEVIEAPKDFKGTLRNYQLIGLNFLKSLSEMGFGGILADEMGLGKTIQVISFLLLEQNKKSLIVAPTSLIFNWNEELKRFAPSLNTAIIHGEKKVRESIIENINDYDVIITTYGTLKNDSQLYEDLNFDYIIIDEAQNIKNHKSQNAKTIKKINGKIKFALTGTPIENNLMELWSIFDFIMPGYLFDEKTFKENYNNCNDEQLRELRTLINPFILRRVKKDVLSELPEKIEKKYVVNMGSTQRLAYKNYMKEIKVNLKSGIDDKFTILSYLTRLRQICQDPSLVNENYKGESEKINVSIDIINEVIQSKNKILVFSQFTSILKKIKYRLDENGISSCYLDGAIQAKERIKLVEEFNNSKDINVFFISLKAGGTGLNLTSANIVLHMDPWWNPAIEDQATDRAHRIGQKNVVEVIKLIAKDTIEENIIKLQEEKREIINSVISDESLNVSNISRLTNDEILELFK